MLVVTASKRTPKQPRVEIYDVRDVISDEHRRDAIACYFIDVLEAPPPCEWGSVVELSRLLCAS